MKRKYLSKIESFEFEPGITGYRHRLQYAHLDKDVTPVSTIAVDPQTGIPTAAAVLCVVGAVDHRQLEEDAALVALPDMKVSATHTPTKNLFKAKCKALGFAAQEIDDVVANADGWADVINHFGKKNDPNFDYRNFDLDES